jgi:DDE superfamily endonuclease
MARARTCQSSHGNGRKSTRGAGFRPGPPAASGPPARTSPTSSAGLFYGIDRLESAYKNLRLIHLPIHASWLNQIELYFSIVQRKALTPNEFHSLDALSPRQGSLLQQSSATRPMST